MPIFRITVFLAFVACTLASKQIDADAFCKERLPNKEGVAGKEEEECKVVCSHDKAFLNHKHVYYKPDGYSCEGSTEKTCLSGHCLDEKDAQRCKDEAAKDQGCMYHCDVEGHEHDCFLEKFNPFCHIHLFKEDGAECHVHIDDKHGHHIIAYGGTCKKGICIKDHDHGHDDLDVHTTAASF